MPGDKQQIGLEEVRRHRSRKSAWIVLNNEVLDVTKFLDEHPGGAETLLEAAGMDATQAFNDVGHSKDAREMTKKYKIGVLPPNEFNSQTCCAGIPRKSSRHNEKIWRTFDGSPSRRSLSRPSRDRLTPSPSGHIGTIIVPRESNLKWVLLAIGLVIVLGFAYKKYSE